MKMKYGVMLAALALLPVAPASAMDSASLLANPQQYRVVYAGEDEVAYVDMDTIHGMQTMDFPGSIENLKFTLYVESYKDKSNEMDFAKGTIVEKIREFDAGLAVNKQEKSFQLEMNLVNVYNTAGEVIPAVDAEKPGDVHRIQADGKELYKQLYRLVRMPRDEAAEASQE